jgi:hypothetical protein
MAGNRTERSMSAPGSTAQKYTMTISRLTVDKLGVKLYDKVSAVIAELVANCYDADATEVTVSAPMGHRLAEKHKGKLKDKGFSIEVADNGVGMTPDEVNQFYLIVGAERRTDPKRGDESSRNKRKVMGRKGVGKLAPFGVCKRIEIITSGGKKLKIGKTQGYLTAHLTLHRDQILSDTDQPYYPEVGQDDGTLRPETGTVVRLRQFDYRQVPDIEDFERQLARRFGVRSPHWAIKLFDTHKPVGDPQHSRTVGAFQVEFRDGTKITFGRETGPSAKVKKPIKFRAFGPDGSILTDLEAEFVHEGNTYHVAGWVGYSKQPYKDELMAGVRIYCRGKIAAQTHIFNMKAGFTGEHDIRSYLVGELHADWLDEAEDLIRTDRQDILWSDPLGRAFEEWGQKLVKKMGSITREPMRKQAWDTFQEQTKIQEVIQMAFPADGQKEIRERTLDIAKTIARTARTDELLDKQHCKSLVDLALLLGPHVTLDAKLREAAESKDAPLTAVTSILKTARIAELSSFGRIADDRVRVIKRVEELKDDKTTLEEVFQSLIEQAPWLIDPQWSPIAANQAFATLKKEFQKFYKQETGNDVALDDFDAARLNKRPDFVLSSQDTVIQIIEIKKPSHGLQNDEMVRIQTYHDVMDAFLKKPGNEDFRKLFTSFHITLVCDEIKLTSVHKQAFDGMKTAGKLTHITWRTFLLRTRKMHEEFLNEAERQRRDAAKNF